MIKLPNIALFALPFVAAACTSTLVSKLTQQGWIDARMAYACKALVLVASFALTRPWRIIQAESRVGGHGVALFVGCSVFGTWIFGDAGYPWVLGPAQDIGYVPWSAERGYDWVWLFVRAFGAIILVPVAEELFWRGFVMRWLVDREFTRIQPAAVPLQYLVISSVGFGLSHRLWFVGAIAGLLLGLLYRFYGRLAVPIIAHASANLLLFAWVLITHEWQWW